MLLRQPLEDNAIYISRSAGQILMGGVAPVESAYERQRVCYRGMSFTGNADAGLAECLPGILAGGRGGHAVDQRGLTCTFTPRAGPPGLPALCQ